MMPTQPPPPSPDDADYLAQMLELQIEYDAYRNLYRRVSEDLAWKDNPGREPLLRMIAEKGTFCKNLVDHAVTDWFQRW